MNITKGQKDMLRVYELSEPKIVFVTCHTIEDDKYKMIIASNMEFPEEQYEQEFVLDLIDEMMIGQRAFLAIDEQAVFVTQYIPNFALKLKDRTKQTIEPFEHFVTIPYYGPETKKQLTIDIIDIFTRSINEMAQTLINRHHYEPFKLSYETNLYRTIDEKVASKMFSGRAVYRNSYMIKKSKEINLTFNVGEIKRIYIRKFKAKIKSSILEKVLMWSKRAKNQVQMAYEKEQDRIEYEKFKAERLIRRKKNSRKKQKFDAYGDPIVIEPKKNNANNKRKYNNKYKRYPKKWKSEWKFYHVTMREYNSGFITFRKPWVYSSPVIIPKEFIGSSNMKVGEIIAKINKIPKHLRMFISISDVISWIQGNINSLDEARMKFLYEINGMMYNDNQ